MNTISKTKLVLLAVVLVGVLFGLSQFSATKDLSGLVTYTNEELGFELQHPKGWEVEVEEADDIHRVYFTPGGVNSERRWWFIDRYTSGNMDEVYDIEALKDRVVGRYDFFGARLGIVDFQIEEEDFNGGKAFTSTVKYGFSATTTIAEFQRVYISDHEHVWIFPTNRVNKEGVDDPYLDIETYRVLIDTFKIL